MIRKRARTRRRGFTLVEMMVGLTLLGVMMTGVFGSIRLSGLITESTIYDNTAATIAQGYLEQIKSIPYEEVLVVAQNPTTEKLNAISPSYSEHGTAVVQTDQISIDPDQQPNERSIQIDVRDDGQGTLIEMPMKFWVSIQDLNTGSSPVDALEIKIKYSFKLPDVVGGNWIDKQVQAIRSRM